MMKCIGKGSHFLGRLKIPSPIGCDVGKTGMTFKTSLADLHAVPSFRVHH